MVKSGIEDYRRHVADSVTNNANAKVLRVDGTVDTVRWRDIQVGDVVVMHDRESCPADLVLLASSDERGSCFIQTRSIDGETNLKQRNAVQQTQQVAGPILHQYTSVLGLSMSTNSIRSRATTVPAPRPAVEPDAADENAAPDGTQLDDAHCNVDLPKYNALLKKVGAELPVFSGSLKVDPPNNQLYRLSGVADLTAIARRQWIKQQLQTLGGEQPSSPSVLEHTVGTRQPLQPPPNSPGPSPQLRMNPGLRSPGLESRLTAPRSVASQQAMSDVASAGVGSSAALGLRTLESEGGVEFEFNSTVQSIDHDSMVLRGTIIRNTKMVLGVAVYTGPDSKIIMNSNESPSKTSRIDAIVNGSMLLILLALVTMCTASTMLSALFKQRERNSHSSYLTFLRDAEHSGRDALGLLQEWITALILFNNLVPISLYVTLELVRWFQARNMENDKKMFDKESGAAMVARTSDINEDLGQVEYVFTDKTGTLTQNSMMFKMCSVGGYVYGASRLKVSVSRRTITRNQIDTPTAGGSNRGFGVSRHISSDMQPVPRVRTKLKISGMNLASSAYVRESSEGESAEKSHSALHLASNGSAGSMRHNDARRSSAPIVAVPMAAEGSALPPRPKGKHPSGAARATVLSDPGLGGVDAVYRPTSHRSDDELPAQPPHQLGFTSGPRGQEHSIVLSGEDEDAGAFYSEDDNTRAKHGSSFTRGNVPVVQVQLMQEQLEGGGASALRDETANASTVHTFDEETLAEVDEHSSQSVDSPDTRTASALLRPGTAASVPSSSGRESSDTSKHDRPDSKGVVTSAARSAVTSNFAARPEHSGQHRSDSSGVATPHARGGIPQVPSSSEGATTEEVKEMLVKACLYKYIPGGFRFFDPRLVSHLQEGDVQSELIAEYLLCLSACHTVVAERPNAMQPGTDDGELEYQAASPDEAALVAAARGFGFEFVDRRGDEIIVSVHGERLTYKVLAINQFSSARRMMSVLLRTPEGRTVLYAKGADQAIMERLWINNPHAVHAYHQHSQAAAMDQAAAAVASEFSMGSGSPTEGAAGAVGVDESHWGLSDADTPTNIRNTTADTSIPNPNVLKSIRNLLSTEQIATSESKNTSGSGGFESMAGTRNVSLTGGTPMNANKGHGGLTTSLSRNLGSFRGDLPAAGSGGSQVPLALSLRNGGFRATEEDSKLGQETHSSPLRSPSGNHSDQGGRGPLGIAAHPRRSSVEDRLAGDAPARSLSGNRREEDAQTVGVAAGIPPRRRGMPSHLSHSVGYIPHHSDGNVPVVQAGGAAADKALSIQAPSGSRPQTSHSTAVSSVADDMGLSPDAVGSDTEQHMAFPVSELLEAPFGYDGVLDWELQHVAIVEQHLHEFGLDGFRVMVMAKREISPETADAWLQLHRDANEALVDRESKLLAAANSIENNLSMLGASAIEDKLQKGVPRTIANLARGGIRMWMLTGDKEETAVNIGVSCRLLTEDMQVLMINGTTREQCIAQLAASRSELRFKNLWDPSTVNENLALVLEGRALQLLLPPNEGFSGFKDGGRNQAGGLVREVLQGMFQSAKDACCCCCSTHRHGASSRGSSHGNPPASGRKRRRSTSGQGAPTGSARSVMSSGVYTARSNRVLVARALAQSSHNVMGGDFDDDDDREANEADNELAQFSACELAVAWVLLTISDLFGTCFSCCRPRRSHHAPAVPPSPVQGLGGRFGFSDDDLDDAGDDHSVSTASTRSFAHHASTTFRSSRSIGSRNGGGANSFTSSRSLIDNKKSRGTSHGTTGMTARRTFERELLEIARQCKAVVGCRLSPLQKAQVVRLVKYGVTPSPLTLAIGDGGNDVSMIQEAHVGVGISGVEGMQAVRASDFALGQFRFLERLLLVHGRFNYHRVAFTISYSFYKNVALVLTLFLFTFFNAFSGATLYESFLGSGWNVLFTVLPVIVVGIYDRDVRPRDALRYPALYQHGQQNRVFSASTLARWMTTAAWHAFATFFGMYALWLSTSIPLQNGTTSSLWLSGAGVNFALVLVVNLRVLVSAQQWSLGTLGSVAFSLVMWVLFVLLYSSLVPFGIRILDIFPFIGVGPQLLQSSAFWLAVIPVVSLVTMLDAAHAYYLRYQKPQLFHLVQEWSHGYGYSFSSNRMAKVVRRFLMWEKDPDSVKKDLHKSARRRKKRMGIAVEDSDLDGSDNDATWTHGTSKLTTMKTVQENRNGGAPQSNSRRSIGSDEYANDSGEDTAAVGNLQRLAGQQGILDGHGRVASQSAIPAAATLGKAGVAAVNTTAVARGNVFSASRRNLPPRSGLTTSLLDRHIPAALGPVPFIDTRVASNTPNVLADLSATPELGPEGSLTPQAFQPALASAPPVTLARHRAATQEISRLPVTAEETSVGNGQHRHADSLRVHTGTAAGYSATAPAAVAPLPPPAAPLPEVEPVPEEEHEGHISQVTQLRSSLWKNMEQQWTGEYREKLRRDKIAELVETAQHRKRRRSSMADFGKSVRRIFTKSNVFQPDDDASSKQLQGASSSIFGRARNLLPGAKSAKSPQTGAAGTDMLGSVAGLSSSPGMPEAPDAFPHDGRLRAQSSPQRNPGPVPSPGTEVRRRAASERPPGSTAGLDTLSDHTGESSKNRLSSDGAQSTGLDRLVDEIVDDEQSLMSGGTTHVSERTRNTPGVLVDDAAAEQTASKARRSQSDASQSNRGTPLTAGRGGTNIDTREVDAGDTPRTGSELLRSNSPGSGHLVSSGGGSDTYEEQAATPNRNARTASRISAASSALAGEGITVDEHTLDANTVMTVSGRTGFTGGTGAGRGEHGAPPKRTGLGPGIALPNSNSPALPISVVTASPAESKSPAPLNAAHSGSKSNMPVSAQRGVTANSSFFKSGSAAGSARNLTMSPTSKARSKAASFWEDSFAIYYMTNTMHGVGGVSSSSRPVISKVLQRFTGNKQMERRFQRQHLAPTGAKILQYLLYLLYVLLVAAVIGEVAAGYQGENGNRAKVSDDVVKYLRRTLVRSFFLVFALGIQASLVCMRSFVLRHYEMFMLGVSLVTGLLILFFNFAEIFMRAMLFLIALFLIMRLHFTHAVFISIVMFLVTLVVASSSETDLAVNTTSFALTAAGFIGFLAYAAYSTGLNMRRDFAQQRQLRVEQRRANRILSNTMPPHITNRILTGLTHGWDSVTPVNAATSAALNSVTPERSMSFGQESSRGNTAAAAGSSSMTGVGQSMQSGQSVQSSKGGQAKGAPPPPPRVKPPKGARTRDLTAGTQGDVSTVVTLNTIIDDSVAIAPQQAAPGAVLVASAASSIPKELGPLSGRSRRKSRRGLGSFSAKPAPTQLFIDEEPNVTVLFVDLLDFPVLVQRHTPSQLVSILDSLYSLFDVLASRHRVYKVESVGKTWMAAAGLSSSRPDHAAACINLGMDIVDHVVQIRNIHGEQSFHMKVGVNSGPLVTGVVGLKKPQFCLFGDTVNTASRMQSTGVMDRVHISPNSEAEVSGLYHLEPREVQVKGKGVMHTYLVRGVRGQPLPKHVQIQEKKKQQSIQASGRGSFVLSAAAPTDSGPIALGEQQAPTTPANFAAAMRRSASVDSTVLGEGQPMMLGVASGNRRRTVSAAVDDEGGLLDEGGDDVASNGTPHNSGAQRGHSMPFGAGSANTGNIHRVGSFGRPPTVAAPQNGSPLARAAKPVLSPPDSPLHAPESGRSNAQSTGPFPPGHSAGSARRQNTISGGTDRAASRARDVSPSHARHRSRSDAAGLRRSRYGLAAQSRVLHGNNGSGSSFGSKRVADEVHLSETQESAITSQAQHFLRTRMKKWKREEEAQLNKSIDALSMAVEMKSVTHTFLDPRLEAQYWLLTMSKRVRRVRVVLGALAVLFFYRAAEVLLATDETFTMRFVGSKLIFSAFTAAFLFLTSGMRRRAARNTVPTWFWLLAYFILLGGAVVLVTTEQTLGVATIDLMMFMVFCSNGRILSVLRSTLLNALVVIALTVTSSVSGSWHIAREREGPVNWQLMFYWFSTLVVTTMAASTTEYHMRRGFGLDCLTVEQTTRAERLLYQMLPRAAVSQLKEGRTGVSDSYRGVTLLFMDLCGFTRMSASLKPTQVVTMLNQLFSHFDKLTDKYRVMKVQTIGDAYIAVAGLPFDDTMSGTWVDPPSIDGDDEGRGVTDDDTNSLSQTSQSEHGQNAQHAARQASASDGNMGVGMNHSLAPTGTNTPLPSNLPSTGTNNFSQLSTQSQLGKKRRASASSVHSPPNTGGGSGTGITSGLRDSSQEEQAAPRLTALHSMAVDHMPTSSPMGSQRQGTHSGRDNGTAFGQTFSMDHMRGVSPSAQQTLKSGSRSARVGRMHSMTSMRDLTASRHVGSGRSATGAQEELDDVKRNAETMLMMAASMQMVVKKVKNPATGEPLTMRVGLHTGNIIAGVIGTRTLRYDMWGADVLAANLMESNARHGGILVSEVTRDALNHLQPYGISFEDAGVVDVNDMGALTTFHVNGDLTNILRRGPPASKAVKGKRK